jgi:hypothetical protein
MNQNNFFPNLCLFYIIIIYPLLLSYMISSVEGEFYTIIFIFLKTNKNSNEKQKNEANKTRRYVGL